MKILAIETSCDETACAIVEDGRFVLSNIIASQIGLHRKLGGVVPELAAREHALNILPVIEKALLKAKLKLKDIDAIAVTYEPGLIGCLLIGRNTAEVLSYVYEKPLIKVNHIHGHIYANWLISKNEKLNIDKFEFPIVVLSVSGGHNDIILMKGHADFELLGKTLDDAAGEAFDKVARMIGLSYPGGPAIQDAAKLGSMNLVFLV
jgi:N6-L-threonylcarbamoyladenine synthase